MPVGILFCSKDQETWHKVHVARGWKTPDNEVYWLRIAKNNTEAEASEKRSIMDLKGRDFLKLLDFTPEEIEYLLDLAADMKDKKKKGIP